MFSSIRSLVPSRRPTARPANPAIQQEEDRGERYQRQDRDRRERQDRDDRRPRPPAEYAPDDQADYVRRDSASPIHRPAVSRTYAALAPGRSTRRSAIPTPVEYADELDEIEADEDPVRGDSYYQGKYLISSDPCDPPSCDSGNWIGT